LVLEYYGRNANHRTFKCSRTFVISFGIDWVSTLKMDWRDFMDAFIGV
jgi:hypothetical protein